MVQYFVLNEIVTVKDGVKSVYDATIMDTPRLVPKEVTKSEIKKCYANNYQPYEKDMKYDENRFDIVYAIKWHIQGGIDYVTSERINKRQFTNERPKRNRITIQGNQKSSNTTMSTRKSSTANTRNQKQEKPPISTSRKSHNKNSTNEDTNSAKIGIKYNNAYYKCEDSMSDGNCFYHSIVKSEHVKEMDNVQLREHVYTTIQNIYQTERGSHKYVIIKKIFSRDNNNEFKEKDFNEFIEKHKKDKEWADTTSILFTALVLDINIESIINICSKFDILSSKELINLYDPNFDTGEKTIYIYNHFHQKLYSIPTETEVRPNHYAYLVPVPTEKINNTDNWFERPNRMDAKPTTILAELVDITNQDDQNTLYDESNESDNAVIIETMKDSENPTTNKVNEESNPKVSEDSDNIANETIGSENLLSEETIDEDSVDENDLSHELELIKSDYFILLGNARKTLVAKRKNKNKKQN